MFLWMGKGKIPLNKKKVLRFEKYCLLFIDIIRSPIYSLP